MDKGDFAKHVLSHWKGVMWHLVDPWETGGGYNVDRSQQYQATLEHVAPFPGRYTLHRGYSSVVSLVTLFSRPTAFAVCCGHITMCCARVDFTLSRLLVSRTACTGLLTDWI